SGQDVSDVEPAAAVDRPRSRGQRAAGACPLPTMIAGAGTVDRRAKPSGLGRNVVTFHRSVLMTNDILAPLKGAERREAGGVALDGARAGTARVKRLIYQPGFRWSTHMKPHVKTDLCMHAHVGFLAQGQIHIQYADGCTLEFAAPQVVAIEPGHDGWVVGD